MIHTRQIAQQFRHLRIEGIDTEEAARLCAAVDEFAIEMQAKLLEKLVEGYTGWSDPAFEGDIIESLKSKVSELAKGDNTQAVDIANFAMMLARMKR